MNATTQKMIAYFDSIGFKYRDDIKTTESGKDVVVVSFGGDNVDTIRIQMFVNTDGEDIAFRVFTVAKVPAAKGDQMKLLMNKLNDEYRWYRFYLDSDSEVTAACDAVVTPETAGPVAHELCQRAASIVDDVYPEIMKNVWA